MAAHNGIYNWVNCSSSESIEDEEEAPQENINVVLQQVLLSSKEEIEHHYFFRSYCLVHKQVYNLVIHYRSCENLVS